MANSNDVVQTYNVRQAAKLIGTSANTLYRALRDGKSDIPFIRVGTRWIVPRAVLHRHLEIAEDAKPLEGKDGRNR